MSFFRKFKANLNLRNPKNKKREKREALEVQCLKYKIISEFTEEQVFNTNPRHFPEQHFTPTQHRKLETKSLTENELLYWQRLAKERPQEEIKKDGEVENMIWPSETDIVSKKVLTQSNKIDSDKETKTQELKIETVEASQNKSDIDNSKIEVMQPNIKSILKNEKEETKKDHFGSGKGRVNFGFENEEGSYEGYEKIDDHLQDNDMYFSDQTQEDEKKLYVVHKANHDRSSSFSENECEQPIKKKEETYDKLNAQPTKPPTYNTLTHPKLNPTLLHANDTENGDWINTFGNTRKLQNKTGYSNQAANIFFDSDEEFDTANHKQNSRKIIFDDNVSEMSA